MEAAIERKPGLYARMRASYMAGLLAACRNQFRSPGRWDEDMVHASAYEEHNTHLLAPPELLMVDVTALAATGGFVPRMEAVNRDLVARLVARHGLPGLLAALPHDDRADLAGDLAALGVGGKPQVQAVPPPGATTSTATATNEWGDVLTLYEQWQAVYGLALLDALRGNLCQAPGGRQTRESLHAAVHGAVAATARATPAATLMVGVAALGATGGFVPQLEARLRGQVAAFLQRHPLPALLDGLQPLDQDALPYDMRLLGLLPG